MTRLGVLALKGAGVLLLAFIVLSVIATVVGLVLSLVATVVSVLVTLAILAGLVVGAAALYSHLWGDDESEFDSSPVSHSRPATETTDPSDRVRSQYVDGDLDEAELERELDRLLEEET
ncbi:hypothetical protein [Natronorubrum daqingense]|uniref:Short C-terminal domain-containing protein n=1 Tax=Natronorubrum daqingense TaxID=588898 RepID=A0A1N7ADH9_9EURY|nr:hypothetical protein [Natronorubrum daqingense]APX98024.1 hypothetical protein BB347_16170 [Natronorubrum daqingense]SIR37132.1 hypothetical protein SAMN05421809_1126 [Natronorubrum daqingense]